MWPTDMQEIDFGVRRKIFLKGIKGGVAFFPAAREQYRNPDVTHPYRQESNFYYLSGFEEPESFLLLAAESETPFQMFVRPRDKSKELWTGSYVGPEGAKEFYDADAAFPSIPETPLEEAFVAALANADRLYYQVGLDAEMDQKVFGWVRKAIKAKGRTGRPMLPLYDPNEVLSDMRLVKSRPEIDRLQQAAQITAEAHINAMRISKPGMYEYEVEAILYHAFRGHGAGRLGYGSIVASGPNACVLHYERNRRKLAEKELLLIDAGAEFDYYTADITRTFPVGGEFTQEQREVYSAVLRAQKECIALVKPGKTMRDIHLHAVEVLTEELKRLKVVKGSTKQLIQKKAYAAYYPHNTGHWLGMDVHDVGKYYNGTFDTLRKLQPGMVFTIEPGLYFAPDSSAPARYKGIGVRIEDDVLVTSGGCKVLTSGAPKEIDEIESLCS